MICPQCNKYHLRLRTDAPQGEATCLCKSGTVLHYAKLTGYDKVHQVAVAEKATLEDDATCLHHPDRQAISLCARCGILMCGYCQTEFGEESLCLTCFSQTHKEQMPVATDSLGSESTRHDRIALALATVPNLFMWPGLICAPMALYVVIRRWREYPYSVLPHSRANLIWASIFAVLTILVWAAVIIGISVGAI